MNTDLEFLLQYTGQYSEFVEGKLKCEHCGNVVTLDNVGMIHPVVIEGLKTIKFWCDNVDCISNSAE